MQLSYTFWTAEEGGYVGYINQYPDYWTQGDDVKELEEMLGSLYRDIMTFDDIHPTVQEHTGLITVPV
jgi:hypothetical protein